MPPPPPPQRPLVQQQPRPQVFQSYGYAQQTTTMPPPPPPPRATVPPPPPPMVSQSYGYAQQTTTMPPPPPPPRATVPPPPMVSQYGYAQQTTTMPPPPPPPRATVPPPPMVSQYGYGQQQQQTSMGFDSSVPMAIPMAPLVQNPCTEEVMRNNQVAFFRDPSDRSSYLICEGVNRFHRMPCASGTFFDERLTQCIPDGFEQNACDSLCKNDADCVVDESNNARCQCKSGFTGQFCEVNIDECALGGNQACAGKLIFS